MIELDGEDQILRIVEEVAIGPGGAVERYGTRTGMEGDAALKIEATGTIAPTACGASATLVNDGGKAEI